MASFFSTVILSGLQGAFGFVALQLAAMAFPSFARFAGFAGFAGFMISNWWV